MNPILKWAGGKRQLAETIQNKFPTFIKNGEKFDYVEPFFGGGAILFKCIRNYNVDRIFINDINSYLIEFYTLTREKPDGLANSILDIINEFDKSQAKDKLYYKFREEFNTLRHGMKKAALFYVLNKSCFNGVYRENKEGNFNVPFGKRKRIEFDLDNFNEISDFLRSHEINFSSNSFEESSLAGSPIKTFYFLDPPYRPISKTSSFTGYSSKSTPNDQLQQRLKQFCDDISSDGGYFLQTNSFSQDQYFQSLYSKYRIEEVWLKRNISAHSSSRGALREILIRNYD